MSGSYSKSGPDAPPGYDRAVTLTSLAILGFSAPFMLLDVIPAPGLRGPGAYLGGLGLAAVAAALQILVVGRVRRWQPLDVPHAWIGIFVIATLVYSIFFWPVVRLGLPWVAAMASGEPFTEQFEMRTHRGALIRNGGCQFSVRGGPLPEPIAPATQLCISQAQYARFPDAPVRVTVAGQRTDWGRHVHRIVAIEASVAP